MNVAPSTLTACVLALAAFATALLVGELARNPIESCSHKILKITKFMLSVTLKVEI